MGSSTARGPVASRANDATGSAFGIGEGPRRPGLRKISRLNGQPTRTPTNACNTPLRTHHHGSGPVRGATALPYGSLIHYSPPVTGASPSNPEIRAIPLAVVRVGPAAPLQTFRPLAERPVTPATRPQTSVSRSESPLTWRRRAASIPPLCEPGPLWGGPLSSTAGLSSLDGGT